MTRQPGDIYIDATLCRGAPDLPELTARAAIDAGCRDIGLWSVATLPSPRSARVYRLANVHPRWSGAGAAVEYDGRCTWICMRAETTGALGCGDRWVRWYPSDDDLRVIFSLPLTWPLAMTPADWWRWHRALFSDHVRPEEMARLAAAVKEASR